MTESSHKRYVALAIFLFALVACGVPGDDISPLSVPIAPAAIPDAGDPIGGIVFVQPDYWPIITGTMRITHELRTLDNDVLGVRVDTQPVVMKTGEPGPRANFTFWWPIAITDTAVNWIFAVIEMDEPVKDTLYGAYYIDAQTPAEIDERGFSPMYTVGVFRQYLPLVPVDRVP